MKLSDLTVAQKRSIEERLVRRMKFECPPQDILASPVMGPCWVWGGPLNDGYGSIDLCFPDKSRLYAKVHRVMFELCHGHPPASVLDHLCRNRACMNPDHVEDVPVRVNNDRGATIKHHNGVCAVCGAAMSPKKGSRYCKPCAYAKGRLYFKNRAATDAEFVAKRREASRRHRARKRAQRLTQTPQNP
jgi:hypothetical protein